MRTPLICLHKASVCLRHAGKNAPILHEIDFSLHKGEHTAIIGANGAGKSTLLKLLRGEIWAQAHAESSLENLSAPITWYVQGKAETSPIMGRRLTGLVSSAAQECYVRQEWRLSGEDILLTAFSDSQLLFFIPEQKQREAVYDMAERLSCTHLLGQEACALSQGQLRLLLLGRALLRAPEVLLLDEYMEGLDASTRALMLKILEQCEATLIFTGHRPSSMPPWIQHTYNLLQGRLTKSESSALKLPKNLSVHSPEIKPAAPPAQAPTPPHIIVDKATVYIDRKALLHDISWTWHQGEHWFLHGANGAGKSTFLRLLASDEHPAWGGTVLHYDIPKTLGQTPTLLKDKVSIDRIVRLVSDKVQATYAMTHGYDATGLELVLSGIDSVQGKYRHYSPEEYSIAEELLQEFSLDFLAHRSVRTFSTGQMRRLLLARALMPACGTSPQILLLDEPFSGLDSSSYTHIRDMLESLSPRMGLLLVSHYEEDRLSCMHHDAYIQDGRLR